MNKSGLLDAVTWCIAHDKNSVALGYMNEAETSVHFALDGYGFSIDRVSAGVYALSSTNEQFDSVESAVCYARSLAAQWSI